MNKLLLLLILFYTSVGYAQPGHKGHKTGDGKEMNSEQRSERFARIKAARQAFITEELELSPKQAAAFFPVYWDFEKRMAEGKRNGPEHNRPGTESPKLTEKEARAKLLQRRTHRQQMLTLSLQAEDEYLKLLPATNVIRLPEIEREFRGKLWDRARKH